MLFALCDEHRPPGFEECCKGHMAERPCIKCGKLFVGQCVDLPKDFPGRLMNFPRAHGARSDRPDLAYGSRSVGAACSARSRREASPKGCDMASHASVIPCDRGATLIGHKRPISVR